MKEQAYLRVFSIVGGICKEGELLDLQDRNLTSANMKRGQHVRD